MGSSSTSSGCCSDETRSLSPGGSSEADAKEEPKGPRGGQEGGLGRGGGGGSSSSSVSSGGDEGYGTGGGGGSSGSSSCSATSGGRRGSLEMSSDGEPLSRMDSEDRSVPGAGGPRAPCPGASPRPRAAGLSGRRRGGCGPLAARPVRCVLRAGAFGRAAPRGRSGPGVVPKGCRRDSSALYRACGSGPGAVPWARRTCGPRGCTWCGQRAEVTAEHKGKSHLAERSEGTALRRG